MSSLWNKQCSICYSWWVCIPFYPCYLLFNPWLIVHFNTNPCLFLTYLPLHCPQRSQSLLNPKILIPPPIYNQPLLMMAAIHRWFKKIRGAHLPDGIILLQQLNFTIKFFCLTWKVKKLVTKENVLGIFQISFYISHLYQVVSHRRYARDPLYLDS